MGVTGAVAAIPLLKCQKKQPSEWSDKNFKKKVQHQHVLDDGIATIVHLPNGVELFELENARCGDDPFPGTIKTEVLYHRKDRDLLEKSIGQYNQTLFHFPDGSFLSMYIAISTISFGWWEIVRFGSKQFKPTDRLGQALIEMKVPLISPSPEYFDDADEYRKARHITCSR